jgi:hypothetical protein
MKILDFFIFLWVIFALLDPDPDQQLKLMRIHDDNNTNYSKKVLDNISFNKQFYKNYH